MGSDKSRVTCDILKEYGIDLNSAANGVFLPYKRNEFVTTEAMHAGGHLNEYYDLINRRIYNIKRKGIMLKQTNLQIQKNICEELQKIRKDLLTGIIKIHN